MSSLSIIVEAYSFQNNRYILYNDYQILKSNVGIAIVFFDDEKFLDNKRAEESN